MKILCEGDPKKKSTRWWRGEIFRCQNCLCKFIIDNAYEIKKEPLRNPECECPHCLEPVEISICTTVRQPD